MYAALDQPLNTGRFSRDSELGFSFFSLLRVHLVQ